MFTHGVYSVVREDKGLEPTVHAQAPTHLDQSYTQTRIYNMYMHYIINIHYVYKYVCMQMYDVWSTHPRLAGGFR